MGRKRLETTPKVKEGRQTKPIQRNNPILPERPKIFRGLLHDSESTCATDRCEEPKPDKRWLGTVLFQGPDGEFWKSKTFH